MNALAAIAAAVLLAGGQLPAQVPGQGPATEPDAEIVENLELLERLDLLVHLEVLTAPTPSGAPEEPPPETLPEKPAPLPPKK